MDHSLSSWSIGTTSSRNEPPASSNVDIGEFLDVVLTAGLERRIFFNTWGLGFIAEGVSCSVYRYTLPVSSNTLSKVAIKVLKGTTTTAAGPPNAHTSEFQKKQIQSFARDARVMCHPPLRRHENIVKILEYGFGFPDRNSDIDEDWAKVTPFIIMELAELGTLKDFISHKAPTMYEKRELCLDVASGLEAMHACGIAHGDVKLENVLVFLHPTRRYIAKLCDFNQSISNLEQDIPSEYLGTERCRPPETRARGVQLSHEQLIKCDIWAFGILVLEILAYRAGREMRYTFENGSADETFQEYLGCDWCTEDQSEVSKAIWERVLNSCLKRDTSKRKPMEHVRTMLDCNRRCDTPAGEPIQYKPIGVLECQELFLDYDAKWHLYKKFLRLSFPEAGFNLFQLGLCHTLGFGVSADQGRALLSLGWIESHKEGMMLASRILNRSSQAWEHSLENLQTEIYYSSRIRAYQKYLTTTLRSSSCTTPPKTFTNLDELREYIHVGGPIGVVTCTAANQKSDLEVFDTLHLASLVGDVDFVELLLEKGASLDSRDPNGRTALHFACMGGHLELVHLFVGKLGADTTIQDSYGCIPLHWLIMFSDAEIEEMGGLLANPRNIDATSSRYDLPTHNLALTGSPLHWAVVSRNREATRTLLHFGADINLLYGNRTALDLAVELHLYEIVELLLSQNASFESGSGFGRSSSHLIAGNTSIYHRQLIHGWHHDCQHAVASTVQVLKKYGCNIDSRDAFLNTPLHRAVASPFERGDFYVIKCLLVNGANRNAQNCDGDTPLHLAIKLAWSDKPNHKKLVDLLVDRTLLPDGAQIGPNIRDNNGRPPLLLLVLFRHIDLMGSLKTIEGFDLLVKDADGNGFLDIHSSNTIENSFTSYRNVIKGLSEKGLGKLPI